MIQAQGIALCLFLCYNEIMNEQFPEEDRMLPAAALESVLGELATDPYGHIENIDPDIARAAHDCSIANIATDVRRTRRQLANIPSQTAGQ